MVDDCVETSMNTLRRNNDDTKVILGFVEGEKPSSISSYTDYSHDYMINTELKKSEWISGAII